RSEAVHHQLSPTALTVTDTFEIMTTPDTAAPTSVSEVTSGPGRVYTLDIEAFRRTRTRHLLGPVPESEGDPTPIGNDQASESVAGSGPVPAEVDTATRVAFGASATDILTVLLALAHWPLAANGGHVVTATRADAIRFVLDTTTLSDEASGPERVSAALSML